MAPRTGIGVRPRLSSLALALGMLSASIAPAPFAAAQTPGTPDARVGPPGVEQDPGKERAALEAALADARRRYVAAEPAGRAAIKAEIDVTKERLAALERQRAEAGTKSAPGANTSGSGEPLPAIVLGAADLGIKIFTYAERSPKSALPELCRRLEWTEAFLAENDPKKGVYELLQERFAAYVPKLPPGRERYGVLVWVNPIDEAWLDPEWVPILERRGIIVIGALGAGNDRLVWYRIGLALDAAHNVAKQYPVDPERLFVGGFSGGGRVAATLGVHFPDVFRGGYYQGGMNDFETVSDPKDPERRWPSRIPKPRPEFLERARRARYVIMVGEKDFNHDHAVLVHARWKRSGFGKLLLQEISGAAHRPAPAGAFEAALAFLEGDAETPR